MQKINFSLQTPRMEETSTQTSLALQSEIRRPKGDQSTVDNFITYVRNLSHFWFTHIILILVLAGYTFGGGYLFHCVEKDRHQEIIFETRDIRNKIMGELWNESQMNNISKLQWILSFKTKMCGYHDRLCFANIWMDEVINDDAAWSVLRAVYYCGTVFTATGYGNIVTTTQAGQMLTVIYAVIGVPYTLTVLLDIGSILTSGLRRAYIEIYKMYYLGCCFWRGAIPSHLKSSNNSVLPTHFTTASTSTYSSDFDEPNDKLYLVTGLKKSDFVIPVWVGFFLIVLYAFLGAWLFFYCESWTYFQSLYFIVASLTTIGFGDFVPKHTSYPLAFLYIMIGLAFVSLFFNLVVERVSKAMHKARRKIKGRLRKENKNLNNLNTLNTGTGSIHLSEEDTSFHQSIITVQLLDSLKNLNRRSSNPQIKTAPVVLLKISDTNLLKYVKYEKVKGKRLPVGYITDRHFMKYLRDKISMDVKKKDSY